MGKQTAAEKLEVTVATYRWGFAIAGIVALVLGILVLAWPHEMVNFASLIIALYAIGAGIVYVYMGIRASDASQLSRTTRIIAGVAFVVVGIIMLTSLGATSNVLVNLMGIMLGILWVVEGATALMLLRQSGSSSTGVLIYSIVAIAIGVILMLTPVWGAGMLRWLVGFGLAGLGVAQIIRAMSVTKQVTVEIED